MTDTTLFNIDEIAAALVDDKDTHEILVGWTDEDSALVSDRWTFRLRIEADEATTFEDLEDPSVFGKIEWIDDHYRPAEFRQRPDGFTGAARILRGEAHQSQVFWYEPPPDFRRFKGSGFPTVEEWEDAADKHLRHVRNVVSWGYQSLGIVVSHVRPDGYRRDWQAWVGGIEYPTEHYGQAKADYDAYVAEMVREQIEEVIHQITQEGTCTP